MQLRFQFKLLQLALLTAFISFVVASLADQPSQRAVRLLVGVACAACSAELAWIAARLTWDSNLSLIWLRRERQRSLAKIASDARPTDSQTDSAAAPPARPGRLTQRGVPAPPPRARAGRSRGAPTWLPVLIWLGFALFLLTGFSLAKEAWTDTVGLTVTLIPASFAGGLVWTLLRRFRRPAAAVLEPSADDS